MGNYYPIAVGLELSDSGKHLGVNVFGYLEHLGVEGAVLFHVNGPSLFAQDIGVVFYEVKQPVFFISHEQTKFCLGDAGRELLVGSRRVERTVEMMLGFLMGFRGSKEPNAKSHSSN